MISTASRMAVRNHIINDEHRPVNGAPTMKPPPRIRFFAVEAVGFIDTMPGSQRQGRSGKGMPLYAGPNNTS